MDAVGGPALARLRRQGCGQDPADECDDATTGTTMFATPAERLRLAFVWQESHSENGHAPAARVASSFGKTVPPIAAGGHLPADLDGAPTSEPPPRRFVCGLRALCTALVAARGGILCG